MADLEISPPKNNQPIKYPPTTDIPSFLRGKTNVLSVLPQ